MRRKVFILGVLALWAITAIGLAEEVNGRIETIRPQDGGQDVSVLYLWGTPYEMGYAHGRMCADQIRKFSEIMIDGMVREMGVPMRVLDEAWNEAEPFIPERYKEEMKGLAEGSGVDLQTIKRVHIIPELSEYHCTFFAAWGRATKSSELHQIRALDYATEAHIQDQPAIIFYAPEGKNAFVSVGWVGFIGVVTGMNEKKIAMSEIGDNYGDEKETLAGEPFVFLARRLLEDASELDQGVEIIRNANRTSSYLYCLGDAKIPSARAFMTCRDFCYVFDSASLPNRQLADVVYFSMGADSGWNEKIYAILKENWSRIDENTGMYEVMRKGETGDLHAVHFNVTNLKVWFANAGIDASPAYDHEFISLDLKDGFSKLRNWQRGGSK